MDSGVQPGLKCIEFIRVPPIRGGPTWEGYSDVLDADRASALRKGPKVIAALTDRGVRVAIGFPFDEHEQIANKAFGKNWQATCQAFGGGELSIDYDSCQVEVIGESTTLKSAVPPTAKPTIIQEMRRVLMSTR